MKTIPLSPPVISMTFGPNNSPLSGKEGTKLTSTMIKDRLNKEIENNVTITLRPSADPETIDVQGRGELQIGSVLKFISYWIAYHSSFLLICCVTGILVETLRREGFEMTICPPTVLAVEGEDGVKREPYEEVTVDVSPELQGMVIDALSDRKGNLLEFRDIGNRTRLIFQVPSRGMMGFRHEIISATRGSATVNSIFSHYDKVNISDFASLKKGKLVSMEQGESTGYALMMVQERGQMFIGVNEPVYEGMVVGEHAKSGDLDVNPCRAKKLSNVRSTGAEEKVSLTPPRRLSVEEVISYMNSDEVLEVTPKSIRLRKRLLDTGERARFNKGKTSSRT